MLFRLITVVTRISDKSARVVLERLVTERIDIIIDITTMISIGSHHLDYLDMLSECRGVCSERNYGKEISQIEKETVLVMDCRYSVTVICSPEMEKRRSQET